MGSTICVQGQAKGLREQLILVPISEEIPQDVLESFVRATVPQLIRYTRGPGRSLDYCTSQWYRDQRGHEPELTAGRYAPKGGSPMELPHNQHLRLKEKGDI